MFLSEDNLFSHVLRASNSTSHLFLVKTSFKKDPRLIGSLERDKLIKPVFAIYLVFGFRLLEINDDNNA